jgi:protein-S-isoprenylcysteine O-methyltransferase Ste14
MKEHFIQIGLVLFSLLCVGFLGAVLSFSAGRWDLPMFWAYCGAYGLLAMIAMLGIDRELLKERIKPGPGALDRSAIIQIKLCGWAHYILAGLDVGRYHWSDNIPRAAQIIALITFVFALGFTIWGMMVNRFFASTVRIQSERGHHVITTGPYRFVRHPGYIGMLIGVTASPIALGSWISGLPMLGFILVILRRVILEDRFLHENLEGYVEYASTTRFRLIPGIW